jgi:hypothetical protein
MRKLLFLLLLASPLLAQEADPYRPFTKLPLGDMLLSLPSTHIPGQGTWEVKFTHRFNQTLSEGSFADQIHTLFGLDTNADVVFGFSKTLRRDLQVSLARSNINDTIEGAVKYVALSQAEAVPASITLRGGFDWRTERNLGDRTSFFAQAIVSRQFYGKIEVFLLPTVVSNAGRAVSGEESVALFDYAFNVPVAVAVMIRPSTSIVAELIPPNHALDFDTDPGWSLGLKRQIGGHWFEILLSNSQATFADQYVTTTWQGSPLDAGDVRLGFNIERRFGRRRR